MLKFYEKTGEETLIAAVNILQSGPYTITEQIGDKDGYRPLKSVTTTTATASSKIKENIEENIKRTIPRFHEHREFKRVKTKHQNIAIIGGGPSLRGQLHELREFDAIMVAGSPHDYLIEHSIIPDYCAVCDPDPISANYLQKPRSSVEYLLASGCDKAVYEQLKNNKIYMWHCYSDEHLSWFQKLEPKCHLIGGGCTIGLRAINLAIMMGYTNIHLFGFDSCMKDDQYHAYEVKDKEKEMAGLGGLMEVKLLPNSDKKYKVAGYQLAQAEHFAQFCYENFNMVSFTFHGDGLLHDLYNMIRSDIQRQQKVTL